ncbi:MAG: helix-turn-helix transcriptional regulator [Bacteroidota bacterium]
MPNKSPIQELIMKFLDSQGMSDRELSKKIGFSHGYLSSLRKGTSMGLDKVEKIIDAFPEITEHLSFSEKGEAPDGATYDDGASMQATGQNAEVKRYSKVTFYELMRVIKTENDAVKREQLVDRAINMVNRLEDEKEEIQQDLMSFVKKLRDV